MTSDKPNFTAVIFDLDGVLIDSEPIYRQVWQTATRRLGFELSDAQHLELIGRGRKLALERCLEIANGALEAGSFDSTLTEVDTEIFSSVKLPLKPGAIEFLSELRKLGIPAAVASSTILSKLEKRLRDTGLYSYLSAIVGGDEVENGKPNPDIFLLAAKRLGVDPKLTLVFEDSSAGIEAAHAGVFTPCYVRDICPVSNETLKLARFTFQSLKDAKLSLL